MASVIDIITLQDAKEFLNITDTRFDAELPAYITTASQMWVNKAGPVAGSPTYSETYDGGVPRIVLRHVPVQSVTSVVESYGTQVRYTLTEQTLQAGGDNSAWGYSVDLSTGLLTRRAAGVAVPFAVGQRNVRVTYTAGFSEVPEDIQHAIRLLVAHLWTTQRGGSRRPGQGGQEGYEPGTSYSWPHRVEEILAAYYVPGVA